jgi:3-hydroxymyristoyl/3-hydroxydecanoyl-(acyl carrier protein) dehydratase
MDNPVAKHLVHKSEEGNVLLSNLRRMLPRTIGVYEMESAWDNLDADGVSVLKSAYHLLESDSILGGGPRYIQRELLGVMKLSDEQFARVRLSLSDEDAAALERYYSPAEDQGSPRFLREIPGDEWLNRIIKTADKREYYLDNALQSKASALIEKFDLGGRDDLYLANMIIDTDHPFFFEHPNEHVPGIMVLEACRQMIIACGHQYGNVPIRDQHMILDVLEARFSGFLELYAPIVLRAELTRKREHRGVWSSVSLEISIHQNGSRSGVVLCTGSNVGSGLFRRIRGMKRGELRTLPFVPGDHEGYTFIIRREGRSHWTEHRLEHVNLSGAELSLSGGEAVTPGPCEFVLLMAGLGTVNGTGVVAEAGPAGQELTFAHPLEAGEGPLELFLKRSCKVPEEAVL